LIREKYNIAYMSDRFFGRLAMKRMIRMLFVLAGAVSLCGFGIACNTMEGAGRDIEKAGDSLEDAAHDAK
jgi:predicted small secreted protein